TQILSLIKEALKREEKFIIFNFKNLEDLNSKINIAGLLLKEIFKLSKKTQHRHTVVLEEAQHFAPERTATDVPSSSENLAYTMAKKIAMEGRKFNLGLIAITQRPANISKYILSQLNTQVILKLINKNDLDAVSVFFETNKAEVFNSLPYLKPGYLYITGLAVPFGYMAKIRLG
ncbi:ATP-binding protein, partial [Hydrogenivirga sp. 128-5-R1-1]|uniref:ATP-binding protein n=1 Tax=Hydrogenivirga sp. 128-5-R1-1 TaxID=392423 RepID=UPI00015EF6D7